MADDVKSRIAELEKELYAKDFKPRAGEDVLTRREAPLAPSWDAKADTAVALGEDLDTEKRHHIMKKFAKFSLIFFVLAGIIAGAIWWGGSNVISGENIKINIDSPVAVAGSEPFETRVVVTNDNKVAVEAATLLVEYPVGFFSARDKTELPRISKDLGVIEPGQSVTESINTILYGEENTSKEVSVVLEYRIAGSNATLRKTTTYAVKISSSPVNIKLGALKEASSGQEVELVIDLSSNSKDALGTLLVDAAYPPGFNFKSADPAPSYGTNIWQVTGLAPDETYKIKIRGIIEGQENEEKIIKVSSGTQSSKNERSIGVVYNATTESIVITKSFLGLDVAVGGSHAPEYVAGLGRSVRVGIYWQSNNPTTVADMTIEVKLKGGALNRYSIYASDGGFYRSIDDTVVWDMTSNPALRSIEPRANGAVGFSFSPRPIDLSAKSLVKNPQVTFEVVARARRTSVANISEIVTTFASRVVKFETDLRLTAGATYFTGPFKNTGPIPPKVEKETTYTISFNARSSSNNVSGTVVKTILPIYVKWLGHIYPEGESLTYNEGTSEVSWNAGRVPSGGSRDASFQVSLLPSLSQLNSPPRLTGDVTVAGVDDFTKTEVKDKKLPINTILSSDPQFSPNGANVVQ